MPNRSNTVLSYSHVQDTYISGELDSHPRNCDQCGTRTRVIRIEGVRLPKGVTLRATILQDKAAAKANQPQCIRFIGIGCGCYAKFHRQLVHITGG